MKKGQIKKEKRASGSTKVFGVTDIPSERVEEVLLVGGYEPHPIKADNYIRELINDKRFHFVKERKVFTLHIDRTSKKGRHFVADWTQMIEKELNRLKKVYLELYPQPKTKETLGEKKAKSQTAPNVKELQKLASELNKNGPRRKKTFLQRLLTSFGDLIPKE